MSDENEGTTRRRSRRLRSQAPIDYAALNTGRRGRLPKPANVVQQRTIRPVATARPVETAQQTPLNQAQRSVIIISTDSTSIQILDTPSTRNVSPATDSQAPSTSSQVPTTNNQAPSTSSQAPTTNNQAPATSSQAPVTNSQASDLSVRRYLPVISLLDRLTAVQRAEPQRNILSSSTASTSSAYLTASTGYSPDISIASASQRSSTQSSQLNAPSTSNTEEMWTILGISRTEYEQSLQAEREFEQIRADEEFARTEQFGNVPRVNVIQQPVNPSLTEFRPATVLLQPSITVEPQPSVSSEADLAAVEEAVQCVICFEEEIKLPTLCVHCNQIIGCFICAKGWFDRVKRSGENGQVPTCPLCRHIWNAQSYKQVGGPPVPAIRNNKKRPKKPKRSRRAV